MKSRKRSEKHQKRRQEAPPARRSHGHKSAGAPRHERQNTHRRPHANPHRPGVTLTGTIQKNPKGFAFILPHDSTRPDVYLPPEEAERVCHGDTVSFTVHTSRGRSVGSVKQILSHNRKHLVSQIRWEHGQSVIITDENEGYFLHSNTKLPKQGWVYAAISQYPSGERPGNAQVLEVLGQDLLPKHDKLVAATKFGIPFEFSDAALFQARSFKEVPKDDSRDDLTHLPFVTIDGEDAKDFDDAVYIETLTGQKAFSLWVAIADVSHYVAHGSALDKDALSRATSTYFPGEVIPMLPEELSNDLCSLRPKVRRLAVVAKIDYLPNGEVCGVDFKTATIQTAGRLTYTELHNHWSNLAEGPWAEPVRRSLVAGKKLYDKLRLRRKQRGVLDFVLPECKIEIDETGKPTRLGAAPHYESHQLIEEFMIAANEVVAAALKKRNISSLYRVHETPDPTKVDELKHLLKTFGVPFTPFDRLTPKVLSQVLESTHKLKIAPTLHQQILRLQKQARYCPQPLGHFGLALSDYTHFTSPIRRYPDLVVHRALKQLIQAPDLSDTKDVVDFDALGLETSYKERRSMDAERFVRRRKQCWFFRDRLGEFFEGRISGFSSYGVFVELKGYTTDGFVPLDAFEEPYTYDESHFCMRSKGSRKLLQVGDPLDVVLAAVSLQEGTITLVPQ